MEKAKRKCKRLRRKSKNIFRNEKIKSQKVYQSQKSMSICNVNIKNSGDGNNLLNGGK